jgi:gas vesicle protein
MAKDRHPVAFMVGAVLGGTIGAIYGLLHAPRPGPQTRADLTERWHDVEERTAQEIAHRETGVRERVGAVQSPEVDIAVMIDAPGHG